MPRTILASARTSRSVSWPQFLGVQDGLIASWLLDDVVTTQSYSRVLNPPIVNTMNILLNPTPTSSTSWTLNANWTYAANLFTHATGSTATVTQAIGATATIGKAYIITYTVSGRTAGTVTVSMGASGTARSANGMYTENIVATSTTLTFTPTSTFDGSISSFSVTQVNVPPSGGMVTQLLADGNMETSGTASWTVGNSATLSKQTGTPHGGTQVLRIARNAVSTPYTSQAILVSGSVYRAYGYCRSDGSATPVLRQNAMVTNLFTGTTSTSWQSFDVVFVANSTDIDLGTTTNTGTQYVEFDDITVALDTSIRQGELTQDNDMEASGTGVWTAVNSATLSKQTTSPHAGTQVLRIARNGTNQPAASQAVAAIGKTYRITGYARSDGTAIPVMRDVNTTLFTGTTSTSWQFFDVVDVATTTSALRFSSTSAAIDGQYVEYDDVSITEIDPLVGKPTNGVTLGSAANGHLTYAYSFDGTNDNVNIYSSDLNSAFNPNEGTLMAWGKVSGSGVWTDVTLRYISILNDGSSNNSIYIRRSSTNNRLQVQYAAGGIASAVNINSQSSTDWLHLAITWSKTNDQFKVYLNGIQSGSTQTGLGTWNGNFTSAGAVIGSSSSAGANPWSGFINDVRIYTKALTAAEVATIYNMGLRTVASVRTSVV